MVKGDEDLLPAAHRLSKISNLEVTQDPAAQIAQVKEGGLPGGGVKPAGSKSVDSQRWWTQGKEWGRECRGHIWPRLEGQDLS